MSFRFDMQSHEVAVSGVVFFAAGPEIESANSSALSVPPCPLATHSSPAPTVDSASNSRANCFTAATTCSPRAAILTAPTRFTTWRRYPERLHLMALDVTEAASIEQAFRAVESQAGALHLLLNNAGINGGGRADRFGDLDPERMMRVFRVNTVGPATIAQRAADLLAAAAGEDELPTVVNVTSALGSIDRTEGASAWQSYRASKAALNMLTRCMAFDLESRGVLAVAITPGWVQTDMGGAGATLTPEESVQNMLSVIDELSMADRGAFLSWKGEHMPW